MTVEGENKTESEKTPESTGISKEKYDAQVEKAHKLEAELVDVQKKLKSFEGINKEKYNAALEEAELLRSQKALTTPEDLEAWKKQTEAEARQTAKDELEAARATATQSQTQLKRYMAQGELAKTDILDAKSMDLLADVIDKSTKVIDGELVFVDREGKPRYRGDDPTSPFTAIDFAEEIAQQYPALDKRHVASGTMKSGKQTEFNGKAPDFSKMSYDEQVKWFEANPEYKLKGAL